MVKKLSVLYALCGLYELASAGLGPMRAVERKARKTTISPRELEARADTNPSLLYPAHTLAVPIDHFLNESRYEPHSNATFNLRYWFDATYYKPGGPVIVLQSGETSGVGRLTFLQKGLLHELAVETNGIGVVLEHRYYGTSIPTPDFSTENLRFLTTEQALADEAFFAQNVVFAGFEKKDLTSAKVPYIAYGGSYAGAFVAFLRKVYPDVFWGAISSSGVVEAIYDYWAYWDPIRTYADQSCITKVEKIINVVDNILIGLNDTATTAQLKAVWGLPNVTYDNDFAYVLTSGVAGWQGKNWDPALNDPTFDEFCTAINNKTILYPQTNGLTSSVKDLLKKGGYKSEVSSLTTPFLNWIGWLAEYTVDNCDDEDQDDCYSTHVPEFYAQDNIKQTWRAWPYQYCTEWGYLQTGSGFPKDKLPIISRTSDLAWNSIICEESFNITTPPDVYRVNKYGGFGLSYPRLAMIDGEQDPWRPATAHASPFNSTAHNRSDTVSEPFLLIKGAVHHWDENGLFPNQTTKLLPPSPVKKAQKKEIKFVKSWLKEWKKLQGKKLKVATLNSYEAPW